MEADTTRPSLLILIQVSPLNKANNGLITKVSHIMATTMAIILKNAVLPNEGNQSEHQNGKANVANCHSQK